MKGAKTCAVALLFLALLAWALYVIMTAAAAQAHTLPMSTVRAGIAREIERRFSIRVIYRLSNCVRVDAHRGQCVIRLYTVPYREKYCGVGWTQVTEKREYSRANLTPCPQPARGLPGEYPDGHPIQASYMAPTSTLLQLHDRVAQQTQGLTYEGLVTIRYIPPCKRKHHPKVWCYEDRKPRLIYPWQPANKRWVSYDDGILRFPKPKPCPSWYENTKRWV